MRIVNKFKFLNKEFLAGELTVGDYMISTRDFPYFLDKVLTEFNDEKPELDEKFLRAFLDILFERGEDLQIFPDKKKANVDDFHIIVGIFMKNMNQWYEDVRDMPLKIFSRILDDMECIMDPKKYDPKRNDKEPDKAAFKKQFGGKSEVKA